MFDINLLKLFTKTFTPPDMKVVKWISDVLVRISFLELRS